MNRQLFNKKSTNNDYGIIIYLYVKVSLKKEIKIFDNQERHFYIDYTKPIKLLNNGKCKNITDIGSPSWN